MLKMYSLPTKLTQERILTKSEQNHKGDKDGHTRYKKMDRK